MSRPPDVPSKKSSWLPACLIGCLVIVVIGAACVIGAGYVAYRMAANQAEAYLDTQPAEVPAVALSEEQKAGVLQRYRQFLDAIKGGKSADPLELTGDDLSVIAEHAAKEASFPGKLHLTIEGDKLNGQVSVPASALGPLALLPAAKDRYLNAEASFSVGLSQGRFNVYLEDMTVKGSPLQEGLLEGFRGKNLAEGIMPSEDMAKIESVELKDGKLIVRPKTPAS